MSRTLTDNPLQPADGRNGDKKRVLMLSHRVPYPLDRGDRIRAYHILRHLSARFDVSLACTSEEPVTIAQQRAVEDLADQVAIHPINRRYGRLRGMAALAGGAAITPACFYRPALAQTVANWHRDNPFQTVFTYCTGMIHYARRLMQTNPAPRHVIDLVDVDSAKWLDYAQNSPVPMRWIYRIESKRLAAIESGKRDHFDAVTVVSDAEADLYRSHVGEHPGLAVLRHAVDVDYFQPLADNDSQTIVFIGVLNYRPNVDGVTWFVHNVMPTLRRRCENARLLIVGRDPSPAVELLNDHPAVEVVGPVADVREYLHKSAAVIAPLRIARGVQTKVLEAMAAARVAVCSPSAAEGIHAHDGQHLIVADQPQQWVEQLENVLTNAELRQRLARNARHQVQQVYPWHKCLEPLEWLISGDDRRAAVSAALKKAA